jgi:hypothetical protein
LGWGVRLRRNDAASKNGTATTFGGGKATDRPGGVGDESGRELHCFGGVAAGEAYCFARCSARVFGFAGMRAVVGAGFEAGAGVCFFAFLGFDMTHSVTELGGRQDQ